MRNISSKDKIVVIYDGQCRFCQASVDWIQQKLSITAIPFQVAELEKFNLTLDQVSKSVYVIADSCNYAGANAIAYLLKNRGNRGLSSLITGSGALGRWAYRWIATHRKSFFVRKMTTWLEYSNSKNGGG